MGNIIPAPVVDFFLIPILQGILVIFNIVPFSRFWTYEFVPTALIKLIVHRTVLEKLNLYRGMHVICIIFYIICFVISLFRIRIMMVVSTMATTTAPVKPIPAGRKAPTAPPKGRPDDGFGTDFEHPTTAMEGAPIGRNMVTLPKHLRGPHGKPEVQLVAQRLLAREEFKPAASQLNVLAASWIQAMVHDWIGHFDGDKTVELDSNTTATGATLCPFAKSPFRFQETKERPDGHYDRYNIIANFSVVI